jgi:hypothetical protein
MLAAACRTDDGHLNDLFFHGESESRYERELRVSQAVVLCCECPVRVDCAAYAERYPSQYGIWGGVPGDEIERQKRRRSLLRSSVRQQKEVDHDPVRDRSEAGAVHAN